MSAKGIIVAILYSMGALTSNAAEVVLLRGERSQTVEPAEIQSVTDFLGLSLDRVDPLSGSRADDTYSKLRSPSTVAVLVAYDALPALDRVRTLAALRRPEGKSIPMLVFGISAGGDDRALAAWSGGAVKSCAAEPAEFRPDVLEFQGVPARSLAGWKLPAVAAPTCDIQVAEGVETVIAARSGSRVSGVLLHARQGTAEVSFAAQMREFDRSWRGDPGGLSKAFSSSAPFLVFLVNAAGDYGWHLDGFYANLTIDDPWLTEPYGHLEYPALLAQMEKHNFHTTIAFIPWNYDRSAPAVAALVRAHGERFSFCVHGNNHTHREFGDYARNPLSGQVANIRQGVARMERFRDLTGIAYDRFMVFPHGAAPAGTLAALAANGFVGTANSLNVPAGISYPADPAFALRPYTAAYGNLLSLARYSVEGQVPAAQIAIHSFLGNPLLLYGHENLFEQGAGGFNAVADLVNRVRPDAHWTGLGEIARHTHLLRRRVDGSVDVRMFANEMDLENPTAGEAVFHVSREEDAERAILAVTVDGVPAEFERSENTVSLRLVVPSRRPAKVRMEYSAVEDPRSEDIRKTSIYAYVLRRSSDFRDLYLSRTSWGRLLTRAYYRRGWDSIELALEKGWRPVAALLGLILTLWSARRMFRRAAARLPQ
jgi:hypothetical protein